MNTNVDQTITELDICALAISTGVLKPTHQEPNMTSLERPKPSEQKIRVTLHTTKTGTWYAACHTGDCIWNDHGRRGQVEASRLEHMQEHRDHP